MNSGKKKYRLQGKTASHRDSIVKSQVTEILRSGKIKTTPAKAKVVKSNFDKLINLAKKTDTGAKNKIRSILSNERTENRLYEIAGKLNDRTSGYTRIIKTLPRKGDNAPQVFVMISSSEEIKKNTEKKSNIQKTLEKQSKKKK